MTAKKRHYYNYRSWDVSKIAMAVDLICDSQSPDFTSQVHVRQIHPDGTETNLQGLEQCQSACDFKSTFVDIHFDRKDERIFASVRSVKIDDADDSYQIDYKAETPSQLLPLIEATERELGLTRHENQETPDRGDTITEIHGGVQRIERLLTGQAGTLSAFVSYRFDEAGKKYAAQVCAVLKLVGVTATTGETYEPREVQAKVKSRLRGNDLVIVILTKGSETAWIRDEMNRGAAVIPLVENGTTFEQGIFGNLEYIPFETNHIGDAFVSLLEGIEFLKRKRRAKQNK